MKRDILILLKFLHKDFYTYVKQLKNYFINYFIIYPVLYSFTYGYVIPNTLFNKSVLPSVSIIFTSAILILIFALNVNLITFLLIDFETDRYVDYQITILNPRLVVIERILFSGLFSFFMLSPFFAISKLILGNNFDTHNIHIFKFLFILFLSTLTCASYIFLSTCILKNHQQTGSWWRRVNNPMLMLGGSWVPWAVMFKFSTILGYIVLANPFLYITEGIRGSLLGNQNQFIPFVYCCFALIFFIIMFIIASTYFFKKRTDFV